jgi:hypothetical protein
MPYSIYPEVKVQFEAPSTHLKPKLLNCWVRTSDFLGIKISRFSPGRVIRSVITSPSS